jgi:uncharacterized coiled-coil DUF342 family protein
VVFVVDNNTTKKIELEELRNSEKKYQSLIEKRNELNDIAKLMREERDMLNDKRKELKEISDKDKKIRDELVAKMKHHKEQRTKFQEQAKALIKAKQQKRGDVQKNLPLRVEELKADIQILEYKQETTPLNTRKENELIDLIKSKKREYQQCVKLLEKQKLIQTDISETDSTITDLFKKADEEHELVQKYYLESQKKHEDFMKHVTEIAASIGESNKKHKKYIELREEAQSYHEKAQEMLSKIMSVKNERRQRWKEAKDILKNQNLKAKNILLNKDKLDEIADGSVDELKKGKKITL